MDPSRVGLSEAGIIRIATFRWTAEDRDPHPELRSLSDPVFGRCRWVGRRLLDAPGLAETIVVSLWDDAIEMDTEVERGQRRMSRNLRAEVANMTIERYTCRAYGAWTRSREPCLIRIFRGAVVEGDPAAFDVATAAAYVSLFEANPSCASIAAGIREGGIVLATLWTNWEAIVSATGGDTRQVLPVQLPGWSVTGSAVHYELVAAEER